MSDWGLAPSLDAPEQTDRTPALSRSSVDRSSVLRTDAGWLDRAWADTASRVLVVGDGQTLVADTDAGPRLVLVTPESAPDGERYLLGVEAATTFWAVSAPTQRARAGQRLAGLRDVGALLDDRDAGLLVEAVALANWHATHTHCPRCGAPTEPDQAGHVRRCTAEGSQHFPRTDPAVIMLVHDGADRCVLGRQAVWPPRRMSALAGFVEPGESAEQAVVREVLEEVGLDVVDVGYRASQPWPFPSSLMLGFFARATGDTLALDQDEIEEARWFTRDELRAAVSAEEVLLPPPVSIAWRLITDWVAGRQPPDQHRPD
ncbi:MAG: NAD(+) diphosphatase [Actinomycetota bacterium]|nr:NAD(+) diphosphatase [Actinomycetota bacterium]